MILIPWMHELGLIGDKPVQKDITAVNTITIALSIIKSSAFLSIC